MLDPASLAALYRYRSRVETEYIYDPGTALLTQVLFMLFQLLLTRGTLCMSIVKIGFGIPPMLERFWMNR